MAYELQKLHYMKVINTYQKDSIVAHSSKENGVTKKFRRTVTDKPRAKVKVN